MTDLIDARREWPDRLYILHPSVKTFGHAVTSPERKEYVRADIPAARIRELEAQLATPQGVADREYLAFTLWKQVADRAAPNVGRTRTPAGFADESEKTRGEWLGLADAALAALKPAVTMADARNAALEEAAKVCDRRAGDAHSFDRETRRAAGMCAADIRALKEPKP